MAQPRKCKTCYHAEADHNNKIFKTVGHIKTIVGHYTWAGTCSCTEFVSRKAEP